MRLDAALEPTASKATLDASIAHWPRLIERVTAECHPEQRAFVEDDARYIAALVGRGGGKTTGGQVRFVRCMLSRKNARCLFVAKTRDHARMLIWQETKDLFDKLGFVQGVDIIFNESLLTATIVKNGASLRLVGADKMADLESLRGKTFHEVGIDEAASHSDKILTYLIREVIGPRLVGCLWLIGTAGKILRGLFYEVTRRGAKLGRLWSARADFPEWNGWSVHRWSLKSAIDATIANPIAKLLELFEAQRIELAAQGMDDDHPAKKREYDAEWAADDTITVYSYRIYNDAGELHNRWDPPRVGPLGIAQLPEAFHDWIHLLAMDPGYSDPTAINAFSLALDDPSRTLYHRYGMEQTKLYAQPIAHILIGPELKHAEPTGIIGALGSWPNAMVSDTAHQMAEALLDELRNVYGIHIEPAQKGFRYKVGAIEIVNGELVSGRIKVLKGSLLEEQLLNLQWDENRSGERIERKGDPNHSADTLVYARAKLGDFISAVPGEPPPAARVDVRSPGYVPPMPQPSEDGELGDLVTADYAALFGDD